MSITYLTTSANYVDLCGPADPIRFDDPRLINLRDFLPNYLRETETYDYVQFFEDFLNTLYEENIRTISATDYENENTIKISILEKINRLSDLHDPELIDFDYLQFFASYLGYNVDISKGELGIFDDSDSSNDDVCTNEDAKRYLRFVVKNLPNWYKIKTTNNAVKIMLYSFGLIGDILTRFTNDYRTDNGNNWITVDEGIDDLSSIPNDFYPTPHYVLRINLDNSSINFSLNNNTRINVLKALSSVQPITNVLDGIEGISRTSTTMFVRLQTQQRLYLTVKLGY